MRFGAHFWKRSQKHMSGCQRIWKPKPAKRRGELAAPDFKNNQQSTTKKAGLLRPAFLKLKLGKSRGREVLSSSFFDTGSLTRQTSQVEQTGSSHFTAADYLNFLNVRRKNRENTLSTDLVRHFSNGERLTSRACISALQHHALELLDTLFVTFTYFHVDVHGVASSKRRDRRALLSVFLLY